MVCIESPFVERGHGVCESRIQEGNILTEECVSTTHSFIVVLTFKRMNNKLFSIVLGNASKV